MRPSVLFRTGVPAVFVALAALTGTLTRAEPLKGQDVESRILSDRAAISVGAFLVSVDTRAQFGIGIFDGTLLSLEDDLGLDSSQQTGRLDGFYRFNKRHAITFGYHLVDRNSTGTVDEPFDLLGIRFQGRVDTEFRSQLFKAFYSYSFDNTGKIEAGFRAGLSVFSFRIGLGGEGQLIDEETGDVDPIIEPTRSKKNVLAPLPSVGGFVGYAITPRLIYRMDVDFVDLKIGDRTGRVIDGKLTFDYLLTKHFGLTAGFNLIDVDYQDEGRRPFRVEYGYGGLLFQLTGVF